MEIFKVLSECPVLHPLRVFNFPLFHSCLKKGFAYQSICISSIEPEQGHGRFRILGRSSVGSDSCSGSCSSSGGEGGPHEPEGHHLAGVLDDEIHKLEKGRIERWELSERRVSQVNSGLSRSFQD